MTVAAIWIWTTLCLEYVVFNDGDPDLTAILLASTFPRMVSSTTLCWVGFTTFIMPQRVDTAPLAVPPLLTILHLLVTLVFDLASPFCAEAALSTLTLLPRALNNIPTETRPCRLGPYNQHLLVQQDQSHTKTTASLHLRREQSAIGSCQRDSSRASIDRTRTAGAVHQVGPHSHTIPLTKITCWHRIRRVPHLGTSGMMSLVDLGARVGTDIAPDLRLWERTGEIRSDWGVPYVFVSRGSRILNRLRTPRTRDDNDPLRVRPGPVHKWRNSVGGHRWFLVATCWNTRLVPTRAVCQVRRHPIGL